MKNMTTTVHMNGKTREYSIFLDRGAILRLSDFIDLNRKVMIITDTGVPAEYAKEVCAQCNQGFIVTVPMGEESKSFKVFEYLCGELLKHKFGREDLVIAVGGGVVGDLSGFAAASYMRGIDFLNIPTTTLSQIDSSIGGKTAINLNGVKNIIGAFHQPVAVIADTDTLKTLDKRQYNNGMIEALKSGLIADKQLFDLFLNGNIKQNEEEIISRSMAVKKRIVEADEEEKGLRKILNFGHTIGHGIESAYDLKGLLHGEAVAAGMLPMIPDKKLRKSVSEIIKGLDINPYPEYDRDIVYNYITNDKKASGGKLSIITVSIPGEAEIKKINIEDIKKYMEVKE